MSGHVPQQQEWHVCRTWSSGSLSAELYAIALSQFETEGPEKVFQEMCIPHFIDKLPQQPVRGLTIVRTIVCRPLAHTRTL